MIKSIILGLLMANPSIALSFTTFSKASLYQCSIAKLKEPSFKICLGGSASRPDMERAKEWATQSSLAWLRVFKAYDNTLSTNIEFSCERPALTIILKNGNGRSYAQAGKTWIYNQAPYGTWTHELGHALVGLGDTYAGSRAGSCRSGQPASLMCWGGYGPRKDRNEYSTLWQDDIDGAMHNYHELFGATLPSASNDPEFSLIASFDVERPYPSGEQVTFTMSDTDVEVDENGVLTKIDYTHEFE